MKQKNTLLMIAIAIALFVHVSPASADEVINMGTLPGGTASHVFAACDGMAVGWAEDSSDRRHAVAFTIVDGISDIDPDIEIESHAQACHSGMVIGHRSSITPETPAGESDRAFAWTKNGGRIDISPPGTAHSYAFHVHNGRVAGSYYLIGDPKPRAFVWTLDGGAIEIPNIPDGADIFPMGIDDTSVALAVATSSDSTTRIAIWNSIDGTMDLGRWGRPLALKNGTMVGEMWNPTHTAMTAFKWTATEGFTDLGTLGGQSSAATAIDDDGRITGTSRTASNEWHSFLYDENEFPPMTDTGVVEEGAPFIDEGELAGTAGVPTGTALATLPATAQGAGSAQTGTSGRASTSRRAYRWKKTQGAVLLPGLGGDFSSAAGINKGDIAGNATNVSGHERAVIWRASNCPSSPQVCRTAVKSTLKIRNNENESKDLIAWKWIKGASTSPVEFGTPDNGGAYTLCLYAGPVSAPLGEFSIPEDPSRWASASTGYKFVAGNPSGIRLKVVLRSSDRDQAKIILKASGRNLPTLPLGSTGLPITVQLIGSDTSVCWEAVYNGVTQSSTSLKAKSQ